MVVVYSSSRSSTTCGSTTPCSLTASFRLSHANAVATTHTYNMEHRPDHRREASTPWPSVPRAHQVVLVRVGACAPGNGRRCLRSQRRAWRNEYQRRSSRAPGKGIHVEEMIQACVFPSNSQECASCVRPCVRMCMGGFCGDAEIYAFAGACPVRVHPTTQRPARRNK